MLSSTTSTLQGNITRGRASPPAPGEIVTLIGANGAGRHPLKTIMGSSPRQDSVRFEGKDISEPAHHWCVTDRACPEVAASSRRMTVLENLSGALRATRRPAPDIAGEMDCYDSGNGPTLGGTLSGGAQQMLATTCADVRNATAPPRDRPWTRPISAAVFQKIARSQARDHGAARRAERPQALSTRIARTSSRPARGTPGPAEDQAKKRSQAYSGEDRPADAMGATQRDRHAARRSAPRAGGCAHEARGSGDRRHLLTATVVALAIALMKRATEPPRSPDGAGRIREAEALSGPRSLRSIAGRDPSPHSAVRWWPRMFDPHRGDRPGNAGATTIGLARVEPADARPIVNEDTGFRSFRKADGARLGCAGSGPKRRKAPRGVGTLRQTAAARCDGPGREVAKSSLVWGSIAYSLATEVWAMHLCRPTSGNRLDANAVRYEVELQQHWHEQSNETDGSALLATVEGTGSRPSRTRPRQEIRTTPRARDRSMGQNLAGSSNGRADQRELHDPPGKASIRRRRNANDNQRSMPTGRSRE